MDVQDYLMYMCALTCTPFFTGGGCAVLQPSQTNMWNWILQDGHIPTVRRNVPFCICTTCLTVLGLHAPIYILIWACYAESKGMLLVWVRSAKSAAYSTSFAKGRSLLTFSILCGCIVLIHGNRGCWWWGNADGMAGGKGSF